MKPLPRAGTRGGHSPERGVPFRSCIAVLQRLSRQRASSEGRSPEARPRLGDLRPGRGAAGFRSLPSPLQHTRVSWPFFSLGSVLCAEEGRLQEAAPLGAPSHGLGSWGRRRAGSCRGRRGWGPRREMPSGLLLFPHRPALNCRDFNY